MESKFLCTKSNLKVGEQKHIVGFACSTTTTLPFGQHIDDTLYRD